MPRLFIAIDLPEEVKAPLTSFPPELPIAHWVHPEQLHLTLRFIGEVGEQTCKAIKVALAKVSFPSFALALRGVGHFPPRKHPRVLWVGMEPCDVLLTLQQDIELALLDAGIAPDERPFSPHITLARLKDTSPAEVSGFEMRHRELACPPIAVKEFILYSSILKHEGAIHQKEAIYPCRETAVSS